MKYRTFKKTYVEGSGPFNAPLLWIGEAPGKTEEARREPFVGYTGKIVRDMLNEAGLDPAQVRFDNAIPYNVYIPSNPAARRRLIHDHKDHLDTSLSMSQAKVVVACGAVALERLIGSRDITAEAGTVNPMRWRDLHPAHRTPDAQVYLIPCIHPASIMRTKIWGDMLFIRRIVERAVAYATEAEGYAPTTPRVWVDPGPDVVRAHLEKTPLVVLDTEFDPSTNIPFMIGFTTPRLMHHEDGPTIISLQKPLERYTHVLSECLRRPTLTKVAHHINAEIGSFLAAGIDCDATNWDDTLILFATLYPDISHSLSTMTRFYLNDVQNWKTMAHDDPAYNALDVLYTYDCHAHLLTELEHADMMDLVRQEIRPASVLCWALEARGLPVDPEVQKSMDASLGAEQDALRLEVIQEVSDLFALRLEQPTTEIEEIETRLDRYRSEQHVPFCCPVHPDYNGTRRKRFAASDACRCQEIYDHSSAIEVRNAYASLQKDRTRLRGKVKRWKTTGFDPGNNDHVRWLLYDPDALGLPVQRNKETRKPTADANAIQRLLALKSTQDKPGVPDLLRKIKRIQHIAKTRSTFLFPPVDDDHIAHPPYRMVLGTGRPASGDDPDTSDRKASPFAFNALNIPKDCRVIYIAHPPPPPPPRTSWYKGASAASDPGTTATGRTHDKR